MPWKKGIKFLTTDSIAKLYWCYGTHALCRVIEGSIKISSELDGRMHMVGTDVGVTICDAIGGWLFWSASAPQTIVRRPSERSERGRSNTRRGARGPFEDPAGATTRLLRTLSVLLSLLQLTLFTVINRYTS